MSMPLPPDFHDLESRSWVGTWLAGRVDAFARTARHPVFWAGARDMTGVSVGMAAWGLMTGVAMIKSGMTISQAVLMSITVFSGSIQLAVLPLMAAGASLWVVWLAAICVGLRFIVFSLHLRSYLMFLPRGRRIALGYFLGDVNYVLYTHRYPKPPQTPRQQRAHVAYVWGTICCGWVSWQTMVMLGIFLGAAFPERWGLEYSGTLALLALTCSLMTDRLRALSALLAAAVAIATYALPYRLNIVVAIVVGMGICLLLEKYASTLRGRRRA